MSWWLTSSGAGRFSPRQPASAAAHRSETAARPRSSIATSGGAAQRVVADQVADGRRQLDAGQVELRQRLGQGGDPLADLGALVDDDPVLAADAAQAAGAHDGLKRLVAHLDGQRARRRLELLEDGLVLHVSTYIAGRPGLGQL